MSDATMPEAAAKNDGTDPAKSDGTSQAVGATRRTCTMNVINKTTRPVSSVELSHLSGKVPSVLSVAHLAAGATSDSKEVNYETGFYADFDYWKIRFTLDGVDYATPNNDRCNISAEDANRTIHCRIEGSINDYKLYVDMPVSTGCSFVVKPL